MVLGFSSPGSKILIGSPLKDFVDGPSSYPTINYKSRIESEAAASFEETKLQKVEEALFKKLTGGSLNFLGKFSPSVGSVGGLITLWNPKFFEAESCLIEVNFIALLGKITSLNIRCLLVNVYAPNEYHKRKELFSKIFDLVSKCGRLVVLGGDFNVVRDQEKKLGESAHKSAMNEFFDFIEGLNLFDLPIHGNHNPVALSISSVSWGPKSFKWFDHWAENKILIAKIKDVCENSKGNGIMHTLRQCKAVSKDWLRQK
ncbi:hypothetical protein V6N13_110637 [Hibiscus sabdariffa]